MPASLIAVVFASSSGDGDAPLEVRERTARRKAPRSVMTLYGNGGWTRAGDSKALDCEAVDRALSGRLGLRRVEGSEWSPLAVEGGVEWHADVEVLG